MKQVFKAPLSLLSRMYVLFLTNMKQVFKALPSLLGGMYVLFLLIYKPEWLFILLPTLIYLLVSLADGRMQWLNNFLLYLLVTSVLLFEGFIHVWPEIVPTRLLSCLHKDVRNPIADMRGYFTSEAMAGTGMAYHYKPNSKHKYPHVVIDKNGYRNTREYQEDVDIVLLGNSLIFAGEAKNDLGELFRQAGYRTMNLAMGGYAPQHYLHSYKNFIVDKKIKHKLVVAFIFAGTDFSNIETFATVENQWGRWEGFFHKPDPDYVLGRPWTFCIVKKISKPWLKTKIPRLKTKITSEEPEVNIYNDAHVIDLPYKRVRTKGYLWWPPNDMNRETRLGMEAMLNSLVDLTRKNMSTLIVFHIPSAPTVYANYYKKFMQFDKNHRWLSSVLAEPLRRRNVHFVDLNEEFQSAISTQFLFTSDGDTHLSTKGTEVLFKILRPIIQSALLKEDMDGT